MLHRVSATQEAHLQSARSNNLPRVEADKALTDAKEALAAASVAAEGECRSGRGARCAGLEQREEAARQRVAEARAGLVGLGAHTVEDPAAQRISALLPISATTYQQIAPALLPLWLEMTRATTSFDRACATSPWGEGESPIGQKRKKTAGLEASRPFKCRCAFASFSDLTKGPQCLSIERLFLRYLDQGACAP